MKIGVNITWLTPGKAGGMENYVRNLLDELEKIDDVNEYYLITAPNNYSTFNHKSKNWHKVIYSGKDTYPSTYLIRSQESGDMHGILQKIYRNFKCFPDKVWNKSIAKLVAALGLDLWFSPVIYSLPLGLQIPTVHTIPDLQHEVYPDNFSPDQLAQRIFGYHYSCYSATATLAISEHVADQLVNNYQLDHDKVIATSLGIEPSFVELTKNIDQVADSTKQKYKLNRPFIYFPAYGWKHKNHEMLIEAFAKVREQGINVDLLFSGEKFDLDNRLAPIIEKFNLSSFVRHLGFIEKQDVLGLYKLADAVVIPSLFEGFGLPTLEAIYLGAPVACSRLGSLVEIAGEAAVYFDPADPTEISEAIISLLSDTKSRLERVELGKERAKMFTYQHTAQKTFEVFKAIKSGNLKQPDVKPFKPLRPQKLLQDGEGRWYFHINDVDSIKIRLESPTRAELVINCNGNQAVSDVVEPGENQKFEIFPQKVNAGNLHQLEIMATKTGQGSVQPVDLIVHEIIAKTAEGRDIKLI